MKKILSLFAAMLVAFAVNAQTDFASPGYKCAADDAVINGDAPATKVYLQSETNPHYIGWSDVSKEYTAVISWTVQATRACYVSVSLDLGPAISSNKHIFEVKILDAAKKELGAVEEGPAYTGDGFTEADQVKALSGKILLPAAGAYTIELRNNRDFCKGSIKNIILTYAGDAPVTDFATPYSCAADDALISGDAPATKVYLQSATDPHYIGWSDVSKSYTAEVSWSFIAKRGCYVSVTLDLGPAISSNKHIFDIELYDAAGNKLDTIAEGPNYTGDGFTEADQTKSLGNILIPAAGTYTLKLMNKRDFCKGSIKNIILSYAADAPAPRTLYLQPNDDWKKDGARFAICILSRIQQWVDMNAVDGVDGLYSAEVATDKQVIFCRMNGETTENIWENKWNQTQDMTLENDKNMCVISGWDGAGAWAKYEPPYVPKYADGFYLVGKFNNVDSWDPATDRIMTKNEEQTEFDEYKIVVDLLEGDMLKVIYSEKDAYTWYPDGMDNDYVVGADYAGNGKTIYFRPDGLGGEGWHYGYIWIDKNETTALENTNAAVKAAKMIENGQLIIIKNGVRFNVLGAIMQ